tara:strand:- start:4540 stop:5460 length:921 start_codon:yes stop_codon:yes gene_type:complete
MNDRPMSTLVVAIASSALFDMKDAFQVYKKKGIDEYTAYQIENENKPFSPGPAFKLVQKLLNLNHHKPLSAEVILLSRNSADTGLRVFNSIEHYDLNITRAAFTNGHPPYKYIDALGAQLFLSAYAEDVRAAIASGYAAATMVAQSDITSTGIQPDELLRVAFDGDAVLFSDEMEKVHQSEGIESVHAQERANAKIPLERGPFYNFVHALGSLQEKFPIDACPVRTALVTARSAPAHERVVRTLRSWGVRVDEAFFLGGRAKGTLLKSFAADIFFDDQKANCDDASSYVTTGHVPFGIINYQKRDS